MKERGREWRPEHIAERSETRTHPVDLPVQRLQAELLRRLNSQERWQGERNLLRAMIDQVPDLLFAKDAESRFIVANIATAIDLSLETPDDLIGKSDLDFYPSHLAQKYFAEEQRVIRLGQAIVDHEERSFNTSAGEKWLSVTKVPLRNERGEIIGLVGTCRDITDRRRADVLRDGQAAVLEMIARNVALEDVLDSLVRLIESQTNGIRGSVLLLDEAGVHLRHGAAPGLHKSYNEAIDGTAIGPKVGSCGTAAYLRKTVVVADIATDPLWQDYRKLAQLHGLRSCWSTPILSHDGAVLGTFAMYSADIRSPNPTELALVETAIRIAGIAIERKHAEDRIQFMAHHDALTGLPNRSMLEPRLDQAISQAARDGRCVTVLFIDLDNFKLVNDSLGHKAGDELLKMIAGRIVNCLGAAGEVFRLGGDEFVASCCGDVDGAEEAIASVVTKVRAAIVAPVIVNGHAFQITCSIGVASSSSEATTAQALLSNADAAMYRAKSSGRDSYQLYTTEMNSKAHEALILQEELRQAVARREFVLHYQPQVDLRSGRISAVEVLVRWQHPVHGLIPPAEFIPLAELLGLIIPLGDWVFEAACRQNKAWQDAGLPPITVCINVSAHQFKHKDWMREIVAALNETGLDARYVELELTESLIMQDMQQAIATMRELERLGLRLSIDDFGTGYSSLSALKSFPVARLKIDQSFVRGIPDDENDKAITAAVISLGQKLNLRVIAEGVENEQQLAFLRENGCDEIQGFYISKPIPAGQFADMLRSDALGYNG